MPTQDIPGYGTTLTRNGATVAQATTLNGPSMSRGERDATHLTSELVTARPTLLDAGELSLSIYYDPADTSHQALSDELVDNEYVPTPDEDPDYILRFNDGDPDATPSPILGSYLRFKGWVKSFGPNGFEKDSTVGADVAIRVTTKPAFIARGTATAQEAADPYEAE